MNVESTFEAEKNLTLIAQRAVLQEWVETRSIRKLVCPSCKSESVNRRMRTRNGCEYRCKDCGQDISEEALPKCCPYPGKYIKCQECRYFQAFAKAVKVKVQEFRHLSPEERAAMVADPNFYQSRKAGLLTLEQNRFEEPDLLAFGSGGMTSSTQLSLFEEGNDLQPSENVLEQLESKAAKD
jgi:hypothetical protein